MKNKFCPHKPSIKINCQLLSFVLWTFSQLAHVSLPNHSTQYFICVLNSSALYSRKHFHLISFSTNFSFFYLSLLFLSHFWLKSNLIICFNFSKLVNNILFKKNPAIFCAVSYTLSEKTSKLSNLSFVSSHLLSLLIRTHKERSHWAISHTYKMCSKVSNFFLLAGLKKYKNFLRHINVRYMFPSQMTINSL